MKYRNDYNNIIKNVKLPVKLDDNYVKNRKKFPDGKNHYTVEYVWGLCGKDLRKTNSNDLSKESFKKLSFDERTTFSEEQKDKFNPNLLLEKGKKFGLGLDKLHKVGLNGNGINIAIIDWPFDYNNKEMLDSEGKSKIISYDDSSIIKKDRNNDGFHGKTVSSLLAGSNVGVAPESKLYYFAANHIEDLEITDILDKIKYLNKQGANIQLISMSAQLKDDQLNETYTKELQKQNCAYINSTNFFKQDFNYMCRDNYKNIDDSNNFELENSFEQNFSKERFDKETENVKHLFSEKENEVENLELELKNSNKKDEISNKIKVLKEKLAKVRPILNMTYEQFIDTRKKIEQKSLYIPCGGRTYPQIGNDGKYMYCGHASASWTIPQVAGIFAISKQIDPNISFDEFSKIARNTATKNTKGYLVINPEYLVREINTRNEIKSKDDDEYKKIYTNSQEYISKLDKIKEVSFNDTLKSMINTENNLNENTSITEKDIEKTR